MAFKIAVNPVHHVIDVLVVVEIIKSENKDIIISWNKTKSDKSDVCLYDKDDKLLGQHNNEITRYLARTMSPLLYGDACPYQRTEIDHWISCAIILQNKLINKELLNYLDNVLMTRTWLVANRLTLADIHTFCVLYRHEYVKLYASDYYNITRWYKHMESLPAFNNALSMIAKNCPPSSKSKDANPQEERSAVKETKTRKQEGKFIDLPGAEMGKVVVRFPPEASGYLHIGHAKAALLNQYYAEAFQGQLIMRFDDTNPAKETVEFEEAILEDLRLLQIKPDRFTHTSDYFEIMQQYCTTLIKNGKAYVDGTPANLMKEQRDQRLKSKYRDNSVAENLALWEEMKRGTEKGQEHCVRAKIDYQSTNGCMRDPTIYRCKPEPHPRTGTKYKVYPTYDFACPIVDAIENVTHTLRTTEYHDRDVQFYWLIEALGLRRPYIWEYSRLNMTHTVLSKRKLTWFVNEGLVDGWDDPRFPTVRGILRRGMTVEGLKQFIIAQGSSRSVVFMEWDKIWAFNKKVIDPVAIRYTALDYNEMIPVHVVDAKDEWLTVQNHPKDSSKGVKRVRVGPKILIEKEDADRLIDGQNTTFINWGNLMIQKIKKQGGNVVGVEARLNLEDKNYKNTLKITWLAESLPTSDPNAEKSNSIKCYAVYFGHIMSVPVLGKDDDFQNFVAKNTRKEIQMLGEVELKRVKKGEIIQLQRKGFFICDVPYASDSYLSRDQPLILFHIPDGHSTTPYMTSEALSRNQDLKTADTKVASTKSKSKPENQEISKAEKISEEITKQGDKVRNLKSSKADKNIIDQEVKVLLSLKSDYKNLTGQEWKPADTKATNKSKTKPENAGNSNAQRISEEITKQGDKVRNLKSSKADKSVIDQEVKVLLNLKSDYKNATGQEWKPADTKAANKSKTKPENAGNSNAERISEEITKQGDKIRNLKSSKADKSVIDQEVKVLLSLKSDYKNATDQEWKPTDAKVASKSKTKPEKKEISNAEKISEEITKQGDKVRNLKSSKADKSVIDQEVKVLLSLKSDYKNATGQDWKPASSEAPSKKEKQKTPKPEKTSEKEVAKNANSSKGADSKKTGTRLGLEAKKEENFHDWYSQVITKSGMIEYYDVSGCYILRPWSFAIWKVIKEFIDKKITDVGVQECYFPIFVTRSVLEKEKAHVADFAPEVAWVTKYGETNLAEPIAIRPTSETIMYPAYAKWLRSDTELPLRLNQWNNVVRWEFKDPKPFLRTREFLWQEGHTAFATKKEAEEEVLMILDMYARVYEDLLAVPVVKGRKTEKEKFAGGDYTTTVEAFISTNGRAIQGATSHYLGQNFSKMFNIQVEGIDGEEKTFVYQNSWGLTTRTIGVMIMIHGDDKGLVLPPNVAPVQVVVIPCGIGADCREELKNDILSQCAVWVETLGKDGIRVKGDFRNNRTVGWKFNHWELKGVPIRIELGPEDMLKNQVTVVRRDTFQRIAVHKGDVRETIPLILNKVHEQLLSRARNKLNEHIKQIEKWSDFNPELNKKNLLLVPFCGEPTCEDKIKQDSTRESTDNESLMGAKSLCIPFDQPKTKPLNELNCIHHGCKNKPKFYTLFGRSY
ncbi:PREDICTED: bifunctional glutamate/proline--tRNA ligase [Wasmannia auropunctata]|uniref:bifunctional glutamate/proline--tRNA ligase n=1 Tax=Wasmannia auropunctata TaxID=64793 RepID=UPI0005EE06AA|nr:PREDICTED: bifunctional glutamate/proline--tRNA ligase [Wasmannia auropunctata]